MHGQAQLMMYLGLNCEVARENWTVLAGLGKIKLWSGLLSSRVASYVNPHLFAQSIQLQLAVLSLTALRMHLVQSVVFIIILRCSFHIICKIIHMSRFSFQLLCLSLTRRVSPPALACHKSQPNERPDRWKQKTLRITFQWKQQNSSR